MTWRRIAPWLIGVIALVAIFIDLPRTTLGLGWLPDDVAGVQFRTVLGLDLQGGLSVTLKVQQQGDEPITDEQVELARDTIERRVAGIGVSEPQVRTETSGDGSRLIVVEVPGVSDEQQVRDLVGSTGQLQFIDPMGQQLTDDQDIRPLLEQGAVRELFDGGEIAARDASLPTSARATRSASRSRSATGAARPGASSRRRTFSSPDRSRSTVASSPPRPSRTRSAAGRRSSPSAPPRRRTRSSARTSSTRCASAPCRSRSPNRPCSTVDPTLGAGFLIQALVAGGIGLLLVLFFMIAYYRLPGVLAAIALVFYTLVVYAIFRIIGVTLTLAGVAAFILSIGMAVDANILIFERMKEEIRAGKTLGPAIEAGFNRAWPSILDSNVSSLLVAGWLYWQGTTVVRGFALVLIVGVLVSMFSAVTVTRTMLRYVTRTSWGRRLELYHVER